MANRILTGAVLGVAVVFGNGCSMQVPGARGATIGDAIGAMKASFHSESEAGMREYGNKYIASEHRPDECPILTGEYQCNSPKLGRYTLKISQDKNAQRETIYNLQRDTKKPMNRTLITGKQNMKNMESAKEKLSNPLATGIATMATAGTALFTSYWYQWIYICRDNSFVMLFRENGGTRKIQTTYTHLESSDLGLETMHFTYSQVTNSNNTDCKRKP